MATTHTTRFTAEDRRVQILDVARALFARKGYDGTTTREIAQAAKVNEAIIFRHFPTKQELYWAVLETMPAENRMYEKLRERLAQGGPIRQVLTDVAESTFIRREKDQTMTRLLFYSALENHELSERFFQKFVVQYYEILSEYIRQQISAGVLKETEPLLAARAFTGMVIYHSLMHNLFGAKVKFSNRQVAETIVSVWLDGMMAEKVSPKFESQETPNV